MSCQLTVMRRSDMIHSACSVENVRKVRLEQKGGDDSTGLGLTLRFPCVTPQSTATSWRSKPAVQPHNCVPSSEMTAMAVQERS